jgi:hypothetical protein
LINRTEDLEEAMLVASPSQQPSVAAALGWVLSDVSRKDLHEQFGPFSGIWEMKSAKLSESLLVMLKRWKLSRQSRRRPV